MTTKSKSTRKAAKVAKTAKHQTKQASKAVKAAGGYGGKVYGPVFAYASGQDAMPTKELVQKAAKATGIPEKNVGFCVSVLRQAKHPTNRGRSENVSADRGLTKIRACSQTVRMTTKSDGKAA